MTAKKPVDLDRISNELELLSARVDSVRGDVHLLSADLAELAAKTANFAESVREVLAGIREAQIRGMR